MFNKQKHILIGSRWYTMLWTGFPLYHALDSDTDLPRYYSGVTLIDLNLDWHLQEVGDLFGFCLVADGLDIIKFGNDVEIIEFAWRRWENDVDPRVYVVEAR